VSKNDKKVSDEVFHFYFLLDLFCAEFISEQKCEKIIEIRQGAELQNYFSFRHRKNFHFSHCGR